MTGEKGLLMDIRDLGVIDYKDALDFQDSFLRKRLKREISDTLIILEHNPVLTLGRLSSRDDICDKGFFNKNNIHVILTTRGGKVTYHSPGQLILYPIIDLRDKKKDIGSYIDFLEKTIVNSLRCIGVEAKRQSSRRGVWVWGKKIAFIGIGVKRWVTFHGASININNDVMPFSRINPCGEKGIEVISVKECIGRDIDMPEVKKIFVNRFIKDFNKEYSFLP